MYILFYGVLMCVHGRTFQAAYIISVVAGFGVGEMLFGRYVSGVAGIH
jgi:hypothetical protein